MILRKLTRWVFGAGSIYHVGMGAIALQGGDASDQSALYLHALYRMIGALMVFVGCIYGLIARDPDASPLLLLFTALLSVLTLFCWGIAMVGGDVAWGQVAFDVLMQIPLLLASALYYPRARQKTLDIVEILATGEWTRARS